MVRRAAPFASYGGFEHLRLFPAGPHGGVLYCGHHINGEPVIACGWTDKLSGGAVVYLKGSASSLSDAASKTNQLRSAVEP
jgi:hypothetical protein